MVEIPEAYEYLEALVQEGSVIFAPLLDMDFHISCERTAERRELYLRTVLDTITDWHHHDHPYLEECLTIIVLLARISK